MAIFWGGLAARLFCAPFLLQWFHPDERQILEFAHFHVHGRLHPFLESQLHLRNQTVPWLFSWVIRVLDALTGVTGTSAGWTEPRLVLLCFHVLIAVWSWLGFWSLIKWLRNSPTGLAYPRAANGLGWFFALFWAFPLLYSRELSEVLSLTPTIWFFLALQRRAPVRAGFWGGWAALLRYPSALWIVGGVLIAVWPRDERRWNGKEFSGAAVGLLLAVALGGLADWSTYGGFLESAPAYWAFNRPAGPAQQLFGQDSLWVYWRWFDYLFSPLLTPIFLAGALLGLRRDRTLGLFVLPYIAGHLLTPHREPRFMLPLTPFLVLAFWQAVLNAHPNRWRWGNSQRMRPSIVVVFASLFISVNFLWYPFYLIGQWESGQGVLIRRFKELASVGADLYLGSEAIHGPMVDALVPANVRWADLEKCQWERPKSESQGSRLPLILAHSRPLRGDCVIWPSLSERFGDMFKRGPWARLGRVQIADFWACQDPEAALGSFCPQGLAPNSTAESFRLENSEMKKRNGKT